MNSWASVAIPPLNERFKLPALNIFDTAARKVCQVSVKPTYRMYVCGITPYDATHLGHANTYLAFDLLHRYLLATGAVVKFVQNITDIDDPLLERAVRDGVDWRDLATSQIDLFRSDMVALHVLPPNHYIGAVEAIPLVVEAISALDSAGSVYKVDEDLYFRVHNDSDFGSRSHLSQDQMLKIFSERGGDPDRPGKSDPLDALLWLSQRPNEPGWQSKYGVGRPGWHIECCAIALNYLDIDPQSSTSIDFQGGGSDLIFPHHEMSAAQSKVMNGKEFASYYVHAGMIGLDGEKMSKSKGNLVFVSKLLNEGVDAMVIRVALLRHHYRADHMWNNQELDSSREFLDDLRIALSRPEVAPTDKAIESIIASLSDDLNSPRALSAIQEWITATKQGQVGGSPGELSRAIDALLGIAI
ncbi:MAG: cysteine--1-D-myo-inosityl 2-amino-2-deoxy-alpha-D-glucopyranoside ligase [Actinobacteria bacterium]|uniref:L-cysteine:1D-myo-inositol 2-amino-2-deoxy-alpha-D-glucopyranoside ligase n=1 Tax=freshwater metagenome TaxID=449393 RepID=A0A6J6FPZ1_9ZZZZ|nr:cysteine--1-D-myo-inosityl 2-amino-2-deoxy-alpha-D-glucopyranoside ligase [Actinomycetota bacterium]